ncbi:hypothetical protein [Rhodopirellula bahusiensis]|uniref:hypothetical protein n=2 Tax=Rhodopirellula bahusiensis TaxID=2014065 RepID=UPI00326497CD
MPRSSHTQSQDFAPKTEAFDALGSSKHSSRRWRRAALAALVTFGVASVGVDSLTAQDSQSTERTNLPPDRSGSADVETNRISDWGLAGIVWSDASLVRKLASESAQRTKDPQQLAEFERLVSQSTSVIQSLESFGWKLRSQQAAQSGRPVTEASHPDTEVMPTNASSETADVSNDETEQPLPDPEEVGKELAKELRRTRPSKASASEDVNEDRETIESPEQVAGLQRFDTETPAGTDDPGSDDEWTAARPPIDVDNYRVDDYVDETPAERANRADAIEDGVEGAIASAAGRLGTGRDLGARISEREIQTLSATLPYSDDSIYDADDYDPDRDYRVDNPLAANPDASTGVDLGDRDDDIGRRADPKVIDGEDEMVAELATENVERKMPARQRRSNFQRFTTEESVQERDAHWVQFQLDSNELVLTRHTTLENLQQRTNDAVTKLKSDASVAWDTTDNEQLKAVLKAISKF